MRRLRKTHTYILTYC